MEESEQEHRKRFMHMEDNEDGTFTVTMYMGGDIGEATVIVVGDMEDILIQNALKHTPEDQEEFRSRSMIIPETPKEA